MKPSVHQGRFTVQGVPFGGGTVVVIAGPCAVENYDDLIEIGRFVKEHGACFLRGGAFKPRTSPKSFQGLGEKGLELLGAVRREIDLPVITEVLDPRHLDKVCRVADILQIGSRNMHNYALLSEVGKAGKPVLLKRGMAATEKEFLLAAEYIHHAGEDRVILCERGMRGVDELTRNMLDLGVIPALRRETNHPIFVDPSHATGRRDFVPAMAKAAIAAGADGLILEVHPRPDRALCDGQQALTFESFADLMKKIQGYADLEGKTFVQKRLAVPS